MKKLTAMIIAMIMIMGLAQTSFAADGKVIASGEGGEGIKWTLTDDGTLTVSGNGPITDEIKIETDEDGDESYSKQNCISWQLEKLIEEKANGAGAAEYERARFDLVKALIIEEGITEIPDDEFDSVFPRSITLPSTLKKMGYTAVRADFADTLTIKNKDLEVGGRFSMSSFNKGETPYASVDEAIAATIKHAGESDKISTATSVVYELSYLLGVKNGIVEDCTAEDYVQAFNEFYKVQFADIDACEAYCLKEINSALSKEYKDSSEIYTLVEDEESSHYERNEEVDAIIDGMYEAVDISARLDSKAVNGEVYEECEFYDWLTINAPKGSNAEEIAKLNGIAFKAEGGAGADGFLGMIKEFFNKIIEFFKSIFARISDLFGSIGR